MQLRLVQSVTLVGDLKVPQLIVTVAIIQTIKTLLTHPMSEWVFRPIVQVAIQPHLVGDQQISHTRIIC